MATHQGRTDDLAAVLGHRTFDVVCAHGLLMYLDDLEVALTALTARLVPAGILSITFRNGAALAFHPSMRRQWHDAFDAFDANTYHNELGLETRAHRLEDVGSFLPQLGLCIETWYGVRVFTDPSSADVTVDEHEFDSLLRADDEAGRRDPYR